MICGLHQACCAVLTVNPRASCLEDIEICCCGADLIARESWAEGEGFDG